MTKSNWASDLALLGFGILLFFSIGLGAHHYLIPSEARYIEIPRQILATGDWLTPHINGVPYFEKPPLFYWMQATAMALFGADEWAGRIVTALLSTLTCLITYATGRMLYGRGTGLLAAGVLATSLMGYGLAHVAMLDVPVTLFITACLACFLAAQKPPSLTLPRKRERGCLVPSPRQGGGLGRGHFYLLMYAASALAMLSKGLIGIVIPGMVIGMWIALTKQWRILREAQLFVGLILFLLIAAPWHILMAQHHSDFLSFYFIHEHFTRYLTDEHKRTAPWWFFIAITPVGLLPWTCVTPHLLRGLPKWREMPQQVRHDNLLLALWILLPLIFFSTSHSKLISYIFPIFPPLAILIGRTLDELWSEELPAKHLRVSAIFLILVLGAALLASQLLPALPGKAGHKLAALTALSLPMLLPIALSLLWLTYTLIAKCSNKAHIIALALVGACLGFTANYAIAPLDTATTKPLAIALKDRLKTDDMVVAYDTYWQDLPVYLNRTISVVNWTGELGFGVTHYPETQAWMISADTFWQRCATAKASVYVFIGEDGFKTLPAHEDCKLHITAQYGKTLLLEKTHD